MELTNENSDRDLLSIAASLRFARFSNLVIQNIKRKDAIMKLSTVMAHTSSIRTLSIVNVEAEEGYAELAQALASNFKAALSFLDLSGNSMGNKGRGTRIKLCGE